MQKITVRNSNQQIVPESPGRVISERFTVKSVDRDSNKELSVERTRPQSNTAVKLDDLLKEKIEVMERVFN